MSMPRAVLTLTFAVAGVLAAGVARGQPGMVDDCMDCHEDADGPKDIFSLPDGSEVSIDVKLNVWESSVHAPLMGCTDCHTEIVDEPHPERTAQTLREYQLQQADTCKRCHYAHHAENLDGIHFALLAKGDTNAPSCVDCHGAHGITDPTTPRLSVDRRCERCHAEVSAAYKRSVHGQALLAGDNPDVPVCTDCHGAHTIKDPGTTAFHVSSHRICATCHSDAAKMAPYGLNPDVVTTYLDDFHGRSNDLFAQGAGEPGQPLATCTDCHGVHDIPSFKSVDVGVVRARVLTTCRKCHEQVPEGFEDAWLSHYPPSLDSAPLVWAVTWFYRIIIPLMLVGLVLHILLHLWRFRLRPARGTS